MRRRQLPFFEFLHPDAFPTLKLMRRGTVITQAHAAAIWRPGPGEVCKLRNSNIRSACRYILKLVSELKGLSVQYPCFKALLSVPSSSAGLCWHNYPKRTRPCAAATASCCTSTCTSSTAYCRTSPLSCPSCSHTQPFCTWAALTQAFR